MPNTNQPLTPAPQAATPKETQPVDGQVLLHVARASQSVGASIEANDLLNPNIVAKPLSSATDGFFTLRPKNPALIFRGVTYRVNMTDGPSFARFEQAKAQGYEPVTPADVDPSTPVPQSCIKEGKIINGDLILMKIDAARYRGALKFKDQQAIKATQKAGATDQVNREISRAMQETGTPGRLAKKLRSFAPTSEELSKDFGEND